MSIRSDMLEAARRGCTLLKHPAQTADFLRSRQNSDGGFRGRAKTSDLYYSVFASEALQALDAPWDRKAFADYLRTFGDGEGLDFVHLCSLARCRATVGGSKSGADKSGAMAVAVCRHADGGELWKRLQAYQSGDEGFSVTPASPHGSAYGSFLALGTWQDLESCCASSSGLDVRPLRASVRSLQAACGGFANETGSAVTATATAAGMVVLAEEEPAVARAAQWLQECLCARGGFVLAPGIPAADLLSTASVMLALTCVPRHPLRQQAVRGLRDFVLGLYHDGGFASCEFDTVADCEYTYYAMIALGLANT